MNKKRCYYCGSDPKYSCECRDGRREALNHVIGIVASRLARNNVPAYMAALEDVKLHVEAAIERLENGSQMESTATVS